MTFSIPQTDLWQTLAATDKTIVLYGMGNGADKILDVCRTRNIPVRACFASDGFVRGQSFRGMEVLSWSAVKEKYGADRVIVLLSFGTSRKDVLDHILEIARETELYAPDVPAFGDTLFDAAFLRAHADDLANARALLSDAESVRIFDDVVRFKATGEIGYLFDAVSDPDEVWNDLIRPRELTSAADLGAYNGDTVRELLARASDPAAGECLCKQIYALEPDERNYQKLAAYAETETRARVIPVNAAAWSESAVLTFDASGNRNASADASRSAILSDRPIRKKEVAADTLDRVLDGTEVNYIKYDVEGSEREALIGSRGTILRHHPTLAVSLYHRSEDLFALPLLLRSLFPFYHGFYLRRYAGLPAWDLNLYVKE